jgi:hypothetical protein
LIAPHKIQEGIPMFSSPASSTSGLIRTVTKNQNKKEMMRGMRMMKRSLSMIRDEVCIISIPMNLGQPSLGLDQAPK